MFLHRHMCDKTNFCPCAPVLAGSSGKASYLLRVNKFDPNRFPHKASNASLKKKKGYCIRITYRTMEHEIQESPSWDHSIHYLLVRIDAEEVPFTYRYKHVLPLHISLIKT